LNELAKLWM